MSDSSVYPEGDTDQDTEATMTAPAEGRPDGSVPDLAGFQDGARSDDGEDQTGSEAPDA